MCGLINMIVNSLLDTDLYKLTMMQIALHKFPSAEVEYEFKCRGAQVDLAKYKDQIEKEIRNLSELSFDLEEINYLREFSYFKPDFLQILKNFRFDFKYVSLFSENNILKIKIEGPWVQVMLFETPVLSIISEIYAAENNGKNNLTEARKRLNHKINLVKDKPDFKFVDFGTRRRYSKAWQEEVLVELAGNLPKNFMGTSNLFFAKKYDLQPHGTMAHEYLQACQALAPGLIDFQKFAFDTWLQEYRGELGIALSDVVGVDAFLKSFDLLHCKAYDGVRHDSGNPFEWGDKVLKHYESLSINSKHKKFIFSDGLNFPKSIELLNYFKNKAHPVFGIGTNLMNDTGAKPLSIVMKMTSCNGMPVAKLSDSPGKNMCKDENYVTYLKGLFNVNP